MSNYAITGCLMNVAADLRLLRQSMPDRRERIATAAMQGILSCGLGIAYDDLATASVRAADALIAELDKPKEEPT